MGFLLHKKHWFLAIIAITICFFSVGIETNARLPASSYLSSAEINWLTSHPIIRVAISKDYAPVSFINEDGRYVGISADYLNNIEQQIQLVNPAFQFKTIVPTPDQQAANNPTDKNVDLVVDFVDTPRRQKYWQFTKPYLSLPLHLIVQQDSKITTQLNQHNNIKVAVVAYYAANELIETDFPNVDLVLVSNNQEGLKKVAFGDVDAFVSDLAVASYWAGKAGLMQLKDAGELPYKYNISFASNNQTPLLHAILEKSLAKINNNQRKKINSNWMIGPFVDKHLFSKLVEWIVLLVAIALAVAAAWLIWRIFAQNKRLAKQQRALATLTQNQLNKSQNQKISMKI